VRLHVERGFLHVDCLFFKGWLGGDKTSCISTSWVIEYEYLEDDE